MKVYPAPVIAPAEFPFRNRSYPATATLSVDAAQVSGRLDEVGLVTLRLDGCVGAVVSGGQGLV